MRTKIANPASDATSNNAQLLSAMAGNSVCIPADWSLEKIGNGGKFERQSRGSQARGLLMLLGLVFKTNNLLPGFTLLCISSRSHLLSWPPIWNIESAAWLIAYSTLTTIDGSTRVRGRGFFALWLVAWGSATSFLLALQMEIRVPLSSLPGPLSLSTALHIVPC